MSTNNLSVSMRLRTIWVTVVSLVVVMTACTDGAESAGRPAETVDERSALASDGQAEEGYRSSPESSPLPKPEQATDAGYEIFGLCQEGAPPSPVLRVDGVAADDPDGGLVARRWPDSESEAVLVLRYDEIGLTGTSSCHDAVDGGRWYELHIDGQYVWANGAFLAADDQTMPNPAHLYFSDFDGRYPTALNPIPRTVPAGQEPIAFLLEGWLAGPGGESTLGSDCEEAFTYTITPTGHVIVHLCIGPTTGHFSDFLFTHSLQTTLRQLPHVSKVSILSNGWCVGDEDTGRHCLEDLDACDYGVALDRPSRTIESHSWVTDNSDRPSATHVHDLSVEIGEDCTTVTVEFGREPTETELLEYKNEPWRRERLIVEENFASVPAAPGNDFRLIDDEAGTTLVLGDGYNIDAFFSKQEIVWDEPGQSSGAALVSAGSIDEAARGVPVVWLSDGSSAPAVTVSETAIVFGFRNASTVGPIVGDSTVISSITQVGPNTLEVTGYGVFFEASGLANVWPTGTAGSGSPVASVTFQAGNPTVGWAPFAIRLPGLEPGDYDLGFTCDQCVEPVEFISVTVDS